MKLDRVQPEPTGRTGLQDCRAWLAATVRRDRSARPRDGSHGILGRRWQPPVPLERLVPLERPGATGASGAIGAVGPAGPVGRHRALRGAIGPQGRAGATGAAGAAVPMGAAGATGAMEPLW